MKKLLFVLIPSIIVALLVVYSCKENVNEPKDS